MSYRVQIIPAPTVIDEDGQPVHDSHVIEITFPGSAIDTLMGQINSITGAGIAKIVVGGATIRGVSLC